MRKRKIHLEHKLKPGETYPHRGIIGSIMSTRTDRETGRRVSFPYEGYGLALCQPEPRDIVVRVEIPGRTKADCRRCLKLAKTP